MERISTRRSVAPRRELARGLQAGHARHRDVEHGEVDVRVQPELDGLGAVAGLGDDGQVRLALEHEPQTAAHDGVVVGEQDAGLQVHSSRVTRAPPRGLLAIRSVAPISTARSRIPRTPPPSGRSAGKPWPSSSTSSREPPSRTSARRAPAWRATLVSASWATR